MMVKIAVLLAFTSMVAAKSVDDKPLDLDPTWLDFSLETDPVSLPNFVLEVFRVNYSSSRFGSSFVGSL